MTMKAPCAVRAKCPYWSARNDESCEMYSGGVYLPLPHHVKMYCLSPQYISCHQYIRGQEQMPPQEKRGERRAGKIREERRKFRRVAEQLPLRMHVRDARIDGAPGNDFRARTLDVSLGGFRIEGPLQVAPGTIVCFAGDGDISARHISGTGEVRWCRPSRKPHRFEFGIAFPDSVEFRA